MEEQTEMSRRVQEILEGHVTGPEARQRIALQATTNNSANRMAPTGTAPTYTASTGKEN